MASLHAVPLLFVLLAPIAAARASAPHIVDPWPDASAIETIDVRHVTFTSSDPFVPRDFGTSPPRTVGAQLFVPATASARNKVPAVVLLHGSAGNASERAATYGPPLAAMGIAVLVVETYASRPDLGTDFVARVLNITESMFVADAYAALGYLAAQPEIDAHRVALAGFSYGGMAATYALYAQIANKLAPPGLRFAGHVAFYAPCIARFADSRTTGAPLLMLYGGKDELMRADRCAQIADDLRRGGSDVQVIVYPDAVHQWDGHRPLGVIGRQLASCRFRVARDGAVWDQRTLLPMNGPFLRKVILALCTSPPPYPIGRSDATVLLSNRDFGRFLNRVFASD